ncbi:MAG: hypothetical protein WC095_02615 [Candidatus Paceibacterota bacterium]
MSQSDREILRQLSLSQANLARIIGTSRQAVNAGIKKETDYITSSVVLMIHKVFVLDDDPRKSVAEQILRDLFSVNVESNFLVTDLLGINLDTEKIQLILNNKALRDSLRDKISQVINNYCDNFKNFFDTQ